MAKVYKAIAHTLLQCVCVCVCVYNAHVQNVDKISIASLQRKRLVEIWVRYKEDLEAIIWECKSVKMQ